MSHQDPVDEARYILDNYSGAALSLFRMRLTMALKNPPVSSATRLAGGVDRAVRRLLRQISKHPEPEQKLAEIRRLLDV